jgi:protein subunit release factor A
MPPLGKRFIEIRAAEGGEDSRLFVAELANAYLRACLREG